jgi:hypothetical protein
MASKRVFIIKKDGMVLDNCHTTLKAAADVAGFPYNTVNRKWKGSYSRKGTEIKELIVKPMKAHGKLR